MTHDVPAVRLDATALVVKLKGQLPTGSAQNYAAMLLLNYIDSYSENCGLQIGERDRLAVTTLPLEFLYMAWCNDVGIELSERQLKSWPPHVWRNSANLGIDLHLLVKQPNLRSTHDKLRDVRTLLSFGAVVNRYYELIQSQAGGLKAFIRTYRPIEVEELVPEPPLPPPSPLLRSLPGTCATGASRRASSSEWNWLPWNKDRNLKNQSIAPLELLQVPGSMPPSPVETLPLYSMDSSLTPSFDSVTTSSLGTKESIASTRISALERLEAYLSVLGTPQCEPVQLLQVRKPRLVSFTRAEKAAKIRTFQESVRKPVQLPLLSLTVTVQREVSGSRNRTIPSLRWKTGEELKYQKNAWKPVDHRLEVLKGSKRSTKLQLEPPKVIISKHMEPDVVAVNETYSNNEVPNVLPLRVVKKGSKAGAD